MGCGLPAKNVYGFSIKLNAIRFPITTDAKENGARRAHQLERTHTLTGTQNGRYCVSHFRALG
jgi:hypothetical protein